ncbi:MAG: hypothetical protein H6636_14495 [Anaerolineales bacterium]|nr:hypothetical protein [Anaerolineales bacterium]
MKRPILKRTVKTIEVVTWTLEYEDAPEGDPVPPISLPATVLSEDNTASQIEPPPPPLDKPPT